MMPISHLIFARDNQKEEGYQGYLMVLSSWDGKEAGAVYKLTQNPRNDNFNQKDIPPMMEWDHPNPEDKTVENSEIWATYAFDRAYDEFIKTEPLYYKCHRIKNSKEGAQKQFNGKGKLSFEDCVWLMKNEVKPLSKYEYNPTGDKWIKKYGEGSLQRAINRAKANGDMALYEDLKRLPKRPDLAYPNQFFWSDITGNISTHEKSRRNNG